jgi:hypothetical protein
MKVRMRTLRAGPDGIFQPGQVVDLPKEVALAYICDRFADPVDPLVVKTSGPEAAAIAPKENASLKSPSFRKR